MNILSEQGQIEAANSNPFVIERAEGFYARVRMEGMPAQEYGPYSSTEEAEDRHHLAMSVWGIIEVNLLNGDGENILAMLRDPIGFVRNHARFVTPKAA